WWHGFKRKTIERISLIGKGSFLLIKIFKYRCRANHHKAKFGDNRRSEQYDIRTPYSPAGCGCEF
ncbi:MAG: hypothetical protein KKF30_03820, partial [Proteobacteria bacterium]|nr:hypothetical protein [Pseudomonadota bacterium]